MARRQREWAKRARLALCIALGGACAQCGRNDNLTIEHIHGRDWELWDVDPSQRVSIYRREAAAGLLTVLCGSCNSKGNNKHKGRRKRGRANPPTRSYTYV